MSAKRSARRSDGIRVRRSPKKGRYDAKTIAAVLDRALVAHVAFVADGEPVCIPTLCAHVGQRLYVHGSRASRAIRELARGRRACLTVVHGLVLARSALEHTVNYESVVAFGRLYEVTGDRERLEALRAFTEKLLPGRWSDVRPPSSQELKATTILAMEIDEASAKIRVGPPDDDDSPDALRDTWAGELPIATIYGAPIASPGLRTGIALAASVGQLLRERARDGAQSATTERPSERRSV
jgi:nitroimidazol reductase NimA-like FMN-containing flavoprotein (pyridoxamine 5'-phosphate oxidase superfamily)